MVTVKSKHEFKDAVFSGSEQIKVTNPELAKWLVAIYGIKQVAWAVAIVVISAGLYSLLVSGGTSAPASAGLIGTSALIVGSGGAAAMVGLGLALGGVTGLKTIRNEYKITEKGDGFVILKRK